MTETTTPNIKSAILEVLKEMFNGNEGETAERLFYSVWVEYKLAMLADEGDTPMTEREIEDYENLFKWWFMGGFNAKSILGS